MPSVDRWSNGRASDAAHLPAGARVLLAMTALSLLSTYVLPLWEVRLIAPQYPEGLGMHILLHTVVGIRPEDLGNINGLNHYIGMKAIEPDTIPALKLMPWGMAALVASGLGAAAWGRRGGARAWVVLFSLCAIAGLVDFWKWEYDYGHSLDTENASIVIPGMSYQPPLIGSKQLLNFTATSWPAPGGWIALAALALAVGVILDDARRRPTKLAPLAASLGVLVTFGCGTPAPRAIVAGADSCQHCRMTLVDPKFAAQVVTATGQQHLFDSIDCGLRWWLAQPEEARGELYLADFRVPATWVPAQEAVILVDGRVKTPMGRSVLAFSAGTPTAGLLREFGGQVVDFEQLQSDPVRHMSLTARHTH
ncbi:MAG: nitrous oxide reductase accessory protein NosL [Gemmatimonadaceae bacterium]|nr:nitrous oxide reductase accessory protein NosL [Gemmatimonadaceae bacterium]